MFQVDPSLKHLAVQRSFVVALYASLNKPHLAVPGKQPQESQAFICGVRSSAGSFRFVVALFLTVTRELVVYTDPDRRAVAASDLQDAEAEAVGFVESMGFMVDNLNWGALPEDQQTELLHTLPPFAADPKVVTRAAQAASAGASATSAARLARLFAAF